MRKLISFIAFICLSSFIAVLIFAATAYLLVMGYFVFFSVDGPYEALPKGELYVRGVIRSKDDAIVALERKSCSADDCHMLLREEVLIRKSVMDEPYSIGETVIVQLDKNETLPDYRRSEIKDGLLNKAIFTTRSISPDRFDTKTVDRGQVIVGIIFGLAALIAGSVGGFLIFSARSVLWNSSDTSKISGKIPSNHARTNLSGRKL